MGINSAQAGITDTVRRALNIFENNEDALQGDCPNGGERSGEDSYLCCKDGKAYDPFTKSYEKVSKSCECPNGGKHSKKDDDVCCKNGWKLDKKSGEYSIFAGESSIFEYSEDICSCPDGGGFVNLKDENGYSDGHVYCCKGNKIYDPSQKGWVDSELCACPDGGERVTPSWLEHHPHAHCCKDGKPWRFGGYDEKLDGPTLCGCPDGGEPSKIDPNVCCKNGWVLDEESGKYDIFQSTPYVCPCPDGGVYFQRENNSGNCCKDGKVYSGNKEKGYVTDDYGYCQGCPAGGTPSKIDPNVCCKNDFGYGFVYSYDKGRYIEDTTGLCYDECPDGGEYIKGEETLINYTRREYASSGCCKDGYLWNRRSKEYSIVVPPICGCPADTEQKGIHCCKNGLELYTLWEEGGNPKNVFDSGENERPDLDYDLQDVPGVGHACGCPDGGTVTPVGLPDTGLYCCKDGFAYDRFKNKYSMEFPQVCGCPYGGKRVRLPDNTYFSERYSEGTTNAVHGYSTDVCCKNGKAFSKTDGDYTVTFAFCGCPDDGEQSKFEETLGICCKNGYAFRDSTKKYDRFFEPACGCPKGGEEKILKTTASTSKSCCKEGFSYSEYRDDYSNIDPSVCGCPDGGTPARTEYSAGRPTQCCKDGKAWDMLEKKWVCDKIGSCNPPCKDGFAYSPEACDYTDIWPSECGCPYGGTPNVEKTATITPYQCCKDGKIWDKVKGGYSEISTICSPICPSNFVICDTETGKCKEVSV